MISKEVALELKLDTKLQVPILLALPYFSLEELSPSNITCNLAVIFLVYCPHPCVNSGQSCSFIFSHHIPSSREKCKEIKTDELLHLQITFDLSEQCSIPFIHRRAHVTLRFLLKR